MSGDTKTGASGAIESEYRRKDPPPVVSANDSIKTTGILHFTIGVRDHVSAARFYADVLGCKHVRSSRKFSFMECHGTNFVLARMPNHVNPNEPDDETHHHAFLVDADEFDRAMEILRARGIRVIKYSEDGHRTFPGRHAYFQDADGNAIEICTLYESGEGSANA